MPDRISTGTKDRRIFKFIAGFGLAGFIVLALLSGSDRQSRQFPNAPSLVGWPYDTGARRSAAIVAFVKTGPKSAIGYARRSILSDPISVQTVSVLARAQLYAGQLAPARKTFSVAGQLGWRDGMTQIYWMDQALQVGDFKVFAERLDALLRQSPEEENRDKFLALISATPEGRSAIAQRLKLSPNWARVYATYVGNLSSDQLAQRVDVMERTGSGVWDCTSIETMAQKLISLGNADKAQSVWRLNCPNSDSLVFDGAFVRIDPTKPSAGFNWSLSDRGDVDISVAQDQSGKRSLNIATAAAVSVPVLRQMVVLSSGRYRLTWQMPGVSEKQSDAVTVSLSCGGGLAQAVNGQLDAQKAETYTRDFTVDAQCPAQTLVFWLAPRSAARLASVTLRPL